MSASHEKDVISLSVIIVSYKNQGILDDCLRSIQQYNDIGDALEVIVVEQSPSDAIFNYLVEKYAWVHVIRNDNNGFGAGNNIGVDNARGKYFLFLNPDTILVESVFSFAIKKFEGNNKLGLFGLRLIDANGAKNRSFHFKKPYGLFRLLCWRICDALDLYLAKSMYICGADMFIRADVFRLAGLFDERIFMYYEETDLAYRIEELGFSTAFYKEKQIVHLEGKSSQTVSITARQLESLKLLCEKRQVSYKRILKKRLHTCLMKCLLRAEKCEDNDEVMLIKRELWNMKNMGVE